MNDRYIPKMLRIQNVNILAEKRKEYDLILEKEMQVFKIYESTRNSRLIAEKELRELKKELNL